MSSRASKIIPDGLEMQVQGLQYRRNSRKLSLDNLPPFVDPHLKKEFDKENPNEECSYVAYVPDGGYGWTIVIVSFLSNFVLDGISVSGGALLPVIREASGKTLRPEFNITGDVIEGKYKDDDKYEYGISIASYSLISSILLSVTLLVGPIISLMTNRFGFRAVGMAGSIVASFGIFMSWACSPYVPNIWVFLFFYGFIGGLGFGMMFQPSVVIVGMWFEKRRALATGIAICGTGIGSIVFPLITTYMADWQGWQGAVLLQAAIALESTAFAFFYRPLPIKYIIVKGPVRKTSAVPLVEADSIWTAMKKTLLEMCPLCKSPTFLVLAVAGAVTMLGFYAPYAFIQDRAVDELGLTEKRAVFAVATIGIANTFGRIIFGLIADHPKVNTLILSNAALTIGGIATILSPFLTEEYQLYIYILIFGFTIAIFAVLRSILILKFMGIEKFNNSFGLALLFMGVGTLIGNPIGGALKDYTRRYDYSFYAAGAYFVISGIMCYPLEFVNNWEKRNLDSHAKNSIENGDKNLEKI